MDLIHLSPSQKAAVLHKNGPMVIFAGAGSGKTRVITNRIAHLMEEGVEPRRILALTFTNKAAKEMQERVAKLIRGLRGVPHVSTFHSAALFWLKSFGAYLGYQQNFSIYDDSDMQNALKSLMKPRVPKDELAMTLGEIKSFINRAKTCGLSSKSSYSEFQRQGIFVPQQGMEYYEEYQNFLKKVNAMDFGDLLLNILELFRSHPEAAQSLSGRYDYLMVDEYQDTNETQIALIQYLTKAHRNVVVVGDDDQSIYSWRGASAHNILEFEKHYPEAKRVILETNYRSNAHIVHAASHMIAHNKKRAAKNILSAKPEGDKIDLFKHQSAEAEAYAIATSIDAERESYPFNKVAVFYRTNAQSRLLETYLVYQKIPYMVYGSLEFYQRFEIKDLISYLRLLVNPSDDLALLRIINSPTRGIGEKAQKDLVTKARSQGLSVWESLEQEFEAKTPGAKQTKLCYFYDLIKSFRVQSAELSLVDCIDMILEGTEYIDFIKRKYPDLASDKQENIRELKAAIRTYAEANPEAKLAELLETLSLNGARKDREGDTVSLMTLHSAKGLEFDRVYIVGVEEQVLPHKGSIHDSQGLEEERRLFYVGITRAREKLSLHLAESRNSFPFGELNPPSRFLRELPKSAINDLVGGSDPRKKAIGASRLDDEDLRPGSLVYHATYGFGTIELVEEDYGKTKIRVDFDDFGSKSVSPRQLEPAD